VPTTRFVRHGEAHIAYQELGRGTIDVLLISAQYGVDLVWEHPGCARMLRQIADFSRLIMFDLVGTGSSDSLRGPWELSLLERWAEEAIAVLDAVDSQRAVLVGIGEQASLALALAAMHPDRTTGVILINGFARFQRSASYPVGFPESVVVRYREVVGARWGTGRLAAFLAPSAANDEDFALMWGRWERLTLGPSDLRAVWLLMEKIDVTPVLGLVRAPVLLLHRQENDYIRIAHARFLAEQLPDARLVELPGADHVFFVGDTEQMMTEIEQFVTGERHVGPSDRLLATVLFSDIATSTELAARVGDRAFAGVLDRHDEVTARQVAHHRGRLVKTTGDGALSRFDGPGRAIACAQAIQREIAAMGLVLRCGLHTGEIEVRGDDIGGIAVHTAARIAALAKPGEILVSRTVTDLVAGSPLRFADRGTHKLKGVPADWPLFAVVQDSLP